MESSPTEAPGRHFTNAGARNLLIFGLGISVAAGLFWSWFVHELAVEDGVAWALLVSGAVLFAIGGYHLGATHRTSEFFDEIESFLGNPSPDTAIQGGPATWAWLVVGGVVYVAAAVVLLLS